MREKKRLRCDSCQLAVINGTVCHETGCPDSWIDPRTGEGKKRECTWCGGQFVPEDKYDKFCDLSCRESYTGY